MTKAIPVVLVACPLLVLVALGLADYGLRFVVGLSLLGLSLLMAASLYVGVRIFSADRGGPVTFRYHSVFEPEPKLWLWKGLDGKLYLNFGKPEEKPPVEEAEAEK